MSILNMVLLSIMHNVDSSCLSCGVDLPWRWRAGKSTHCGEHNTCNPHYPTNPKDPSNYILKREVSTEDHTYDSFDRNPAYPMFGYFGPLGQRNGLPLWRCACSSGCSASSCQSRQEGTTVWAQSVFVAAGALSQVMVIQTKPHTIRFLFRKPCKTNSATFCFGVWSCSLSFSGHKQNGGI